VAVEIRPRVAVLDVDPELGQGLAPDQLAAARAVAITTVVTLPRGAWRPPARAGAGGHLGLLVLDGLLTRTIGLLGRTSMQLLGAEDLVRPWDDDGSIGSVPRTVTWTVHEPARVAARSAAVPTARGCRTASRRASWRPEDDRRGYAAAA
jgi:CRP/FNR family cyclic AMP-dependent transcriptional regulator